MADQDARALLLTIQANTELLRSNLSAAERAMQDFTSKVEQHLDESDKRFELFGHSIEALEGPLERLKAVGEGAFTFLLGESLIEKGKEALEFAGNVKFMSEQVGTSTDFLQKYRFAAGQFGVGTEEADTGLRKFARSIGEAANGNKGLVETFDRLGVKVLDSGGNVRSVQAVFLDTANAISKVDNPAQRTADTLTLMGRGAAGLTPLLAQGASGFNDLAAAAQQLGVVLGPELIEHSEEVNHKLAALKQIINAQMSSAIAQNAGSIEILATAFVKLAGGISQFLSGHPERALTILGLLAGSKIGGVPGAIALGIAGNVVGNHLKDEETEESTDPAVRRQALKNAAQAYLLAHNTSRSESDLASEHGGGLASDPAAEEEAARREYVRQRALYAKALHAKHESSEGGLGSDEAGATNDDGGDLKKAQAELASLEKQKVGASGDVLKAYDEEIAAKRRQIAFIKQGATAEMASSLAAKQAGAAKAGETAAREAARKAQEAARKAAEEQQRQLSEDRAYHGELGQADRAIGEANLKLSDTPEAREEAEITRLRAELAQHNGQLDDQVAAHALDPTHGLAPDRAMELRIRYGSAEQLGEQYAGRQRGDADAESDLGVQTEVLGSSRDHLQAMQDLAVTTEQRKALALKLLDIDQQIELASLTYQRDHATTQDARDKAQYQIDTLPQRTADKTAQINDQDGGPIAQYRRQLQSTTGSINNQMQQFEVDSVQTLGDHFETAATKALHLHGVMGSLIGDLIKMAEQDALLAILGKGGASGGGVFSLIGKLFGGGRATGGNVSGSQFYVVGENGPEIFAPGRSGTIIPNHAITASPRAIIPATVPSLQALGEQRAQMTRVQLEVAANDYFDARVSSISGGRVQEAAPHIASAGATLGQQQEARRRSRAL